MGALLLRFVWSPGAPGRPPVVICTQSVRDGAAIVIHRQRGPVASSRVMSCHVASCRVMSSHLRSCHVAMLCRVMSGHVASCHLCHAMRHDMSRFRHVTSRGGVSAMNVAMLCRVMSYHVWSCRIMSSLSCPGMSRRVMSRHVVSGHVMPCHVVSCPCLSCRTASRRDRRPQHIDTATSLSHYANARRSHSRSSYSYRSRSHRLRSHRSPSCARVVLSTSHSFRLRLPTRVFYFSFRGGVIRSYFCYLCFCPENGKTESRPE